MGMAQLVVTAVLVEGRSKSLVARDYGSDRLDTTGVVTLRHNSTLHHIGIGRPHARTHAGQRVLILIKDLHIRVLTDTGELLRELTLDPHRDYQPQPKP
jgi:hypothetical protein